MNFLKKYSLTCVLIFGILISWATVVYSETTKYATCYGALYWNIDTRKDATTAANNFSKAGYISFARHNYDAGMAYRHISTDNIFFFSGHGNSGLIEFDDGEKTSRIYAKSNSSSNTLNTKDLSNVRLAIYGSCLSAETGDNTGNLLDVSYDQGVKCAIGWAGTVNAGQHSTWLSEFSYRLRKGDTVLDARWAADAKVRSVWGSRTGGTENHRCRGSNTITIY
jgi:hypothetical protein